MNRAPMVAGNATKRSKLVEATLAKMAARLAEATGLQEGSPELAALLKLSTEVVERVVWEVVPDLAEQIIRENLEQLAAARQIEAVVGVAAVEGAPAHRDKAGVTQLSEVVGDKRLRLPQRAGQLAHPTVATRELVQQPPAKRMPRQLEHDRDAHELEDTSNGLYLSGASAQPPEPFD